MKRMERIENLDLVAFREQGIVGADVFIRISTAYVAAGGLAPDHSRWISARHSFFLPIGVLSRVFRGKFVAGLRNAFHRGELQFHGELLAASSSARLRSMAAGTVPP